MFYERGYTCVGLLKDRAFVLGSNLMMDFEVSIINLLTCFLDNAKHLSLYSVLKCLPKRENFRFRCGHLLVIYLTSWLRCNINRLNTDNF